MTNAENALPYCEECDAVGGCDCDSVAELVSRMVDPEDRSGFRPVRLARLVRAKAPLRIDASDVLWSYYSGVWRQDKPVVSRALPLVMGDHYRKHKHLGTVTDRILAELSVEGQTIDPSQPDLDHVALPSELFNFRTGEQVDHNPDVMTFYRLASDPVFDSPTPKLDEFLDLILPAEDHERFLDMLTSAILPGNPRNDVFLLVGEGGNGKTRALELLKALVPKAYRSAVPLRKLGSRFDTARMFGKVLNICGDISGRHLSDTETFKLISGGDDATVERKGVDATEAPIWAKMIFSANQIPSCSDTTEGFFRRWVVFEFPYKLDWDEEREAALHAEAPAIIGRLLRRAVENRHTIRESDAGKRAFDQLRLEADVVAQWWDETSLHAEGFLDRTDAFEDYVRWAEASKRMPMSNREFFKRLRRLFGVKDYNTSKNRRGWLVPTSAVHCTSTAHFEPTSAVVSTQVTGQKGPYTAQTAHTDPNLMYTSGTAPVFVWDADGHRLIVGEGGVVHDPFCDLCQGAAPRSGEAPDRAPTREGRDTLSERSHVASQPLGGRG